jgi:creatinine amidohydrolase/Fe(II)-dependent formamide hydrolase-like protein
MRRIALSIPLAAFFCSATAHLPGTIASTGSIFASLNKPVAGQMIVNGFRKIVLMADHVGEQKELAEVAARLDEKNWSKGIRVGYCDDFYKKAGDEFSKWSEEDGPPAGSHASLKDTSELLYPAGDKGWVSKDLIPTAAGKPVGGGAEAPVAGAQRSNSYHEHDASEVIV